MEWCESGEKRSCCQYLKLLSVVLCQSSVRLPCTLNTKQSSRISLHFISLHTGMRQECKVAAGLLVCKWEWFPYLLNSEVTLYQLLSRQMVEEEQETISFGGFQREHKIKEKKWRSETWACFLINISELCLRIWSGSSGLLWLLCYSVAI